MESLLAGVMWLALAYLSGSIPFGLAVAKTACGVDPRQAGSRNIGATNVARLCGTKYGVISLILDILKGLLPVLLAGLFIDGAFFLGCAALATILGHMYSPFLGFSGGKGVAVTIGSFVGLAFWPLILSVALCALVIAQSGFVSLGSLTLAAALPVLLLLFGHLAAIPFALAAMTLIFWKHRDNIDRLAKGEEKSWRKSKQGNAAG